MQNTAILILSVTAIATLTDKRFVSPTGGLPSAGGNTLGVANSDASSGDICPVNHLGTAVVEVSEAIAKGAEIETGNDGRAATKDTGITVARALQEATASGQFIEVALIPN